MKKVYFKEKLPEVLCNLTPEQEEAFTEVGNKIVDVAVRHQKKVDSYVTAISFIAGGIVGLVATYFQYRK